MTVNDKAAIGYSIGIAAVAAAIAFYGASGQIASVPNTPFIPIEPQETLDEPEPTPTEMIEEDTMDAEMIEEDTMDADEPMSTGPITWEVVNPAGTSVPGCEEDNTCFIPNMLEINVGDTVMWRNDDAAAHTITSGSPSTGPDGVFDSSLVMGGATFEHTFEEPGTYDYFCLVHPWMLGSVQVN